MHLGSIWIVMHPSKYMDLIIRCKKGVRVVHADLDIFFRRLVPSVYPDLIRQTRPCGIGLKNILSLRRSIDGYFDVLSNLKSAGRKYDRRIPIKVYCLTKRRYFGGCSLCFQAHYGDDDRCISFACHFNRNLILFFERYGFRKHFGLFAKLIRREDEFPVYVNCASDHPFLTTFSALHRYNELLADILNGKTLSHSLRFAALTGEKLRAEDKGMPIGARDQAIAEKQ